MTAICGHDAEIAALLDGLRGDRPHHAWLLAGPAGIGKASIARAVAARRLAEAAGPPPPGKGLDLSAEHPTAHLLAAHSHPDFQLLDRLPAKKEDRARPRADWPAELARSITIEQIRELNKRFALRTTYSAWRFVVVDAIDDLERAAANALLKSLEEPPAGTIFLLVSHAPGRLLPTIRSRCRLLRFAPLDDVKMAAAMRAALPDALDAEIAGLVAAGQGAPGRALGFAGLDVAGLDKAMAEIARSGDPDNKRRAALARSLALKPAQPRYEAFLARAPSFIAARARERGAQAGGAVEVWAEARALASSAVGLSLDQQTVTFQLGTLIARLHSPR